MPTVWWTVLIGHEYLILLKSLDSLNQDLLNNIYHDHQNKSFISKQVN